MTKMSKIKIRISLILAFFLVFIPPVFPLQKQDFKIVSWNLLEFSGSNESDRIKEYRLILDEIDPDILLVQEMESLNAVKLFLNEVLNHTKKIFKYGRFFDGPDSDNAAYFKKRYFKLISTQQIPTSFRDITEYQFKVKNGPGKSVNFRIYSTNFKEGKKVGDEQMRTNSAQTLRTYLDGLPSNLPFMVCGSLNFYSSEEDGFNILTADSGSTAGRLKDPLNASGKWHDNKNFSKLHTQSTRKKKIGKGASGGLDDRFDMILISSWFENNEQLSYLPNSYITFGNDGNHFNKAVNKPKNKLITKTLADSLHKTSDRLPIELKLGPYSELDRGIIAFASERTGNGDIYVMDSKGNNPKRVTIHENPDHWPSWSPDGTRITFASILDGNVDIFVINADGSNRIRLTTHTSGDFDPAWSYDGKHIAWGSQRDGNSEIYIMNEDGSDKTRLTNNPAIDGYPNWSPDGSKIAFVTDRDGNWEIYVMESDGTNQTRITNNSSNEWLTVWSPQGDRFVFVSDRDGNNEIYIMNADGSGQTRMTNNTCSDMEPSWSPSGKYITFNSNRSGNHEIYIMEILPGPKPGKITRLTDNSVEDDHPVWIEDPGKFNF